MVIPTWIFRNAMDFGNFLGCNSGVCTYKQAHEVSIHATGQGTGKLPGKELLMTEVNLCHQLTSASPRSLLSVPHDLQYKL